jgi:hypothetical protein
LNQIFIEMKSNANYEGIYKTVYSQLQNLDKNLYYHGIHHTFEDVIPFAEMLSKEEKLSEEDHLILMTSALFHGIF